MNGHQFVDRYSPVNQGYLKHKQKQYEEWRDDEVYSEELFWNELVQLGWRQNQKEKNVVGEIILTLQLVLECPDCSKAIKTVDTLVIGHSVKVKVLLMAKQDIERHQDFYCEAKATPKGEADEVLY